MKSVSKKIGLLGAALALALGGLALSACTEEHEHVYGGWTVVSEATCTESGERYRECTVCGYRDEEILPYLDHDFHIVATTKEATCTEEGERTLECTRCKTTITETIAKLNHDWNEGEIITPSTCVEAGTLRLTCTVCGTTEDQALFLAPHDMKEESRTPAKCEEDGVVHYVCSVCNYTEDEIIPATGHKWVSLGENKEPTCTEKGEHNRECSVCGTIDKQVIDALGHELPAEYTIDEFPSFTKSGSKSYHCRRCGEHVDSVEIPMLQENVPVPFEFALLRNNGEKILDPNIVITVYDGNTVVAKSDAGTLVKGVFTVSLDPGSAAAPKTYTAKVEGLPKGYTAKESYTVSPSNPYCPIWLTAAPLNGTPSRTERYKVGSVMYDFTIPAENNNTGKDITLSELLKTKKAVVLNFWYTTCGPCQQEFPYLVDAYNKYKDDIALIAIDEASTDSMVAVKQFAYEYGLPFPVAFSTSLGIQSAFGFTTVPQTVVIDGEGVVMEIHSGSSDFNTFDKLFAPYVSDGYWTNPEKAPSAPAATAALPTLALSPRKRETY